MPEIPNPQMLGVMQAAVDAGLSRADVRLVTEIARHAALQANDSLVTVTATLPTHLQLLARVLAWQAIAGASVKTAKDAEAVAIALATRG